MTTVANSVARTLTEAGIDTVFGLPGGENVAVLDALRGHGIRFILVHNESSAVYMAATNARLSGRPGVCLTTLGPGVTNAMAGIGHAYLDRAPVLVITAMMDDDLRPHHTHQYLDQQQLVRGSTKGSFALHPENVESAVRSALALTMHDRPGPVHLQLSKEVAQQAVKEANQAEATHAPTIDLTALPAAAAILADARHPIIVAGLGLEPQKPYVELNALAEALQAPVICTPKAKGALPADHPLAAGVLGLTRTDPVYELLEEADCILAVGFDVVELVKPWDEQASLIWIAPWRNEDPTLRATAELVGPLKELLSGLKEVAPQAAAGWGADRVAAFRQKLAARPLPDPAPGHMLPQTLLTALRESLPADTAVTTDVGSHKILAALTWPDLIPNRYFLSNGLSCMGFGLPAAIAASLALGGQTTVCITGDGGLAMVMGELGLLSTLKTPVIIVLMNDGALDLIRSAQRRAGYATYATEFVNPDYSHIAAAYGLATRRVSTPLECRAAIHHALETAQPMLIDARIDPVSYPTTPA